MAIPAKDILKALVGFDTTSRNSNLELISWVEGFLHERGVAATRIYDETGEKANLLATIGPADLPGYVLSGHTDVVPVDGQAWTHDPFDLIQRDGKLYGRGACDMKGFLACVLARVDAMRAAPLKKPFHIAFSYDEEVGCKGVPTLIEKMTETLPVPEACFVGEPTEMQVVTGHKAKRSLRAIVTGRACHSSLAPEGVNAIDYAARMIVRIKEMSDRLERGARDEQYDVPFSTGHTGTIAGGTALNIVPERCEFAFEFRVLPNEDADALVAEIKDYAAGLETEMKARAPEASIAFEWISNFPGLDTAGDAEVTRLAKRLAGHNDHSRVAYGTEGGLFQSMAAIPTIVIGPGSIVQAHKPDEFVAVSQLDACEAFLDRLIETASG
ncbi:acetylornithine deacetylase [Stappia sp. F7233]|uniref:Acetylornithine deacetylase n=1 Tax=Stappia albiluteola TaxID=2758565 RepID=A0A839AIL2_9HYPH|nr:acetylornithine deacetylase [Stappia albiluteola]MBA5778764.1 acetylornithine deacetylase [Stappia albiluteola]